MRTLLTSILVVVTACGSKTKPPVDPGGGGDQTSCEPGRCLEDISKAIGERRDETRKCYDEGRQRDPKMMEGKVIINFSIDDKGAVGETSQGMQDGQIEELGLVTCLSEIITTVRFAASSKGKTTRAYHRFEFAP